MAIEPVCHQVAMTQVNVDILKIDVFLIIPKGKLNGITKTISLFHKTLKFFLTLNPCEEYIIYVPKPNK